MSKLIHLYPRQSGAPVVGLYKTSSVQAGAIQASSRSDADPITVPNLSTGYVPQDSTLTVLTLGGDPQRRVSIGIGGYIT